MTLIRFTVAQGSRLLMLSLMMAVVSLSSLTILFGATTSAFAFPRISQQQHTTFNSPQRQASRSSTTRLFDSESQQHDWDVLQKTLQQKIQQQKQSEERQQQQKQQQRMKSPEDDLLTSSSSSSFSAELPLPTPHTDYTAQDVVTLCMNHLQDNHVPVPNAGLQVCFDFSSDRCRAACGGNLHAFCQYAANPIFSMLLYQEDWKIVSVGPIIAGTPTRGAMQTVLIEVPATAATTSTIPGTISATNKATPKRFLWTLQQERRPPLQGCWLVHEVLFTKNAFALTM